LLRVVEPLELLGNLIDLSLELIDPRMRHVLYLCKLLGHFGQHDSASGGNLPEPSFDPVAGGALTQPQHGRDSEPGGQKHEETFRTHHPPPSESSHPSRDELAPKRLRMVLAPVPGDVTTKID